MVFVGGGRFGGRRRGPYGGGFGRGGYGPGYGRGYGRGGGGCARDACLLESGCCLAESLNGGCLVALVLALPSLIPSLRIGRPRRRGRGTGVLLSLVRWYQADISPRRPAACHFTPSCSHFAAEALECHGALVGSWLTMLRLLRCRPGGRRGADPVPLRRPLPRRRRA